MKRIFFLACTLVFLGMLTNRLAGGQARLVKSNLTTASSWIRQILDSPKSTMDPVAEQGGGKPSEKVHLTGRHVVIYAPREEKENATRLLPMGDYVVECYAHNLETRIDFLQDATVLTPI